MVIRRRLNINGPAVVFVTTTVFDWQPVLIQEPVAKIIIQELQNIQKLFSLSILSYVIMPSHVHLLLGIPEIKRLSKIIQGYKGVTSRQVKKMSINELRENDYKLWKPRFDDLIIHSEKQLSIKIEYIHSNPVKAGLVQQSENWLYSSAVDWLTNRKGLIKIDKEFKWITKR